jgi:N-acetyl-gamma-glutamyl-phosphate reductase
LPEPIPVAVVGASGYTGAELVRLLLSHAGVRIAAVTAGKRAGEKLHDVFPQFRGLCDAALEAVDAQALARRARVAFLALPHGESAALARDLLADGLLVLDLSADLRLHDAAEHQQWYGQDAAPELRARAVYGLPELHRDRLRDACLVAVPGCYPTATLLALAPLVRGGLISTEGLVVDAKSGVSGAGRNPAPHTHYPEAAEGVRAYGVAGHRHTPEIEQELSEIASRPVRVTFTPHLLPMNRGMLATCYGRANAPAEKLRAALLEAYRDERFVEVAERPPDSAHLRGSNRAHVFATVDARTGQAVAMAAIDNLVKGASGQAVQCMNLALGFPEDEGLRGAGVFP